MRIVPLLLLGLLPSWTLQDSGEDVPARDERAAAAGDLVEAWGRRIFEVYEGERDALVRYGFLSDADAEDRDALCEASSASFACDFTPLAVTLATLSASPSCRA